MCIPPRSTSLRCRAVLLLSCESPPMSRRHLYRPVRPSKSIVEVLEAFDISCSCKLTLIVSCAVGGVSGCRERSRVGTCDCRPRYLPACILDTAGGIGCSVWREGKSCRCQRLHMPRCLAIGCEKRRRGKRCDCPRTPTELCPHVVAKLAEYAKLTPRDAERIADAWAERLWTLLPEEYADKPTAHSGCSVQTREDAINLMALRQAWGLSLRHPSDRILLNDDKDTEKLRRQASGLKLLFSCAEAGRKGSDL